MSNGHLSLINSSRGTQDTSSDYGAYPASEGEWKDRYQWLHDSYVADPYTLGDLTGWRLFRAHDDNGKLMAETTRILRDNAFVIDRDADGLFGAGFALELEDGRAATSGSSSVLSAAEAIWKRSRFTERLPVYGTAIASMGRLGMETVLLPDGTVAVVNHDPRTFSVFYDPETGLDIVKVIIRQDYFDPDDVDDSGNVVADAAWNKWVRTIDKEGIRTTLNDVEQPEQTGLHGLGVVPFVNLLWKEYREPEHGLHASAGMERGLSLLDSAITQIQAVGNRYGDPKMWVSGAKFADDNDAVQFGRQMSLPTDAKLGYLEPTMQGVKAILEQLGVVNKMIRGTFPEFGVFGGGANASAEALAYLAQAYISKVMGARGRIHPQIARALGMGVAMQQGTAFDPESVLYRIEAGPVLPVDTSAELEDIHDIKTQGGFAPGDYTRHLQRLGLVGLEHDPEKYEEAAGESQAARALAFMTAGPAGTLPDPDEDTDDEDTDA